MATARERPNAVVVGYGFAGRCFHAYLIGLTPDLHLHGIAARRPEVRDRAREELGTETYAAFEDVLADPVVDLVVLATPNDLHAPHAIAAMEAGKHVVTDKPMCLSLSEADDMLAAARQTGRLLTVFQNRRWDGDYLTVRLALEQGLLGDLRSIETAWGQYGPPRGWRGSQEHGGGRLLDLGAHMIDQALQLVPSPAERVYARLCSDIWETDVEDHAHCILTFANGVDAHITTSSLTRQPRPRWYILGTGATLIKEGVDPQEQAMIAGDIDAAREDPVRYPRLWTEIAGRSAETVLEPVPGRWRCFYENVAAAIMGTEELAVQPESVRAVVAVLDAARESAATGAAVCLEGVSGH